MIVTAGKERRNDGWMKRTTHHPFGRLEAVALAPQSASCSLSLSASSPQRRDGTEWKEKVKESQMDKKLGTEREREKGRIHPVESLFFGRDLCSSCAAVLLWLLALHIRHQIDWAPLNWGWARITPFLLLLLLFFANLIPSVFSLLCVCFDRERRNHRLVVCVSCRQRLELCL